MSFRHALMLVALLAGAPFANAADDAAPAPAAVAAAAPLSEGEVKKVDTAAGKLTIKHGHYALGDYANRQYAQ